MATEKTYTAVVVDRSGSMWRNKEDAEGGVRAFLEDLASLEGTHHAALYQFDTKFDKVWGPVQLFDALEQFTLQPRGNTALFDAMGMVIEDTKQQIEQMAKDDRPEKVAIVTMTDGKENSSQEYTFEAVQKLISERKSQGWEFVFLAGTLEAKQFAEAAGIRATVSYDPQQQGQTRSVIGTASNATMDWYQGDTERIETPESVQASEGTPRRSSGSRNKK